MMDKITRYIVTGLVLAVLGYAGYYVYSLKAEIRDLRQERIASDSLKRVAEDQYEMKVREVASERTLRVSLGAVNEGLLNELKKKDAKIRELSVIVVHLRDDSAHGIILASDWVPADSGIQRYFGIDCDLVCRGTLEGVAIAPSWGVSQGDSVRFIVHSENGIVTFEGLALLRAGKVLGKFTFKQFPPISIVLYENDLNYVNARIGMDESLMDLVTFDVQAYRPEVGKEGFRLLLGAGPARAFDDNVSFGLSALGGVTWRKWGVAGVVGPNMYSLMLIKLF